MPTVPSGLSFGSFLSAFPPSILFALLPLASLGVGKSARATCLSRRFLIGFWMVCWAAACGIALITWQRQRSWLHKEALSSGYGSISYFEHHGFNAAQALHYHTTYLVGVNGYQILHNQSLSRLIWYGILFLLLPAVLYGIDRRRPQLPGAAVSAAV